MPREKSCKINLYKIDDRYKFTDLDFDGSDGFKKEFEDNKRRLFIQRQKPGVPSWLAYLKPLINSGLDKIKNYSSSFILVAKHNNSVYVLSGGHNYSKLEKYIEDDFGVRMALRMIKEKGILALNQRSLKGSTRQIYRAVIGYDPIFDKDNFTRVLNAIEGTGEFEGKSFRVSGRSALSLRTTKDITRLSEVLTEVENIAGCEEKIHFPKSYVIEKNETLTKSLDDEMFRMITAYWSGSSDRDRLYLEFKDAFTQFRCTRFEGKFGKIRIGFEDFDLDIIKELFKKEGLKKIKSLDDLDKILLIGFNEDGYEEFKGKFQDLLVCEISRDGKSFIKMSKRWLRILEEIQEFIDDELRKVEVLRNSLPMWDRNKHREELDYNNFVANQKKWKCMDHQCVQMQGFSKIEVCDIFDKSEKKFFHIKETWGSKATYLFTQGTTAAEFFYNSLDFRKKCIDKWPGEFSHDYLNYKIVFGIAASRAEENDFPLNLTFFAKLNLYHAISSLKQIDYEALLAPIKIVN